MTLTAILILAAGTYALRLTGPALSERIELSDRTRAWLPLPAIALLAALVATSTLLSAGHFAGVARLAGVCVGILAALRRAPLVVVIILAAATTAALRQLGLS